MRRALSSTLGVLLATVSLVAVLLALLDWRTPWFKRPIAAAISAQLERDVTLSDDLDLDLSGTTRLRAGDVRVANAEWASAEPMLELGGLEASLDLGALLRGETRLVRVRLREPRIVVERREDGTLNWDLPTRDEPGPPPAIEALTVTDAQVIYRDAALEQEVQLRIAGLTGHVSADGLLELQGSGQLERQDLAVRIAAAQQLPERDDWRVNAEIEPGKSRLSARGTVAKPDLELAFSGPDLAALNALPVIDFPGTPPVNASARLTRDGGHWLLEGIHARIGPQAVSGDVRVDADQDPILIYATLHADEVRVPREPEPMPPPEERLIPAVPIETAALHRLDLRAKLTVGRVELEPFTLRNVALSVRLHQGRLEVDPASMQLAQGRVQGRWILDGRHRVPRATVHLTLGDMELERGADPDHRTDHRARDRAGSRPARGSGCGRARARRLARAGGRAAARDRSRPGPGSKLRGPARRSAGEAALGMICP